MMEEIRRRRRRRRRILAEVVKPAREVDSIAGEIQKEVDLVGCPANDEAAADHQ